VPEPSRPGLYRLSRGRGEVAKSLPKQDQITLVIGLLIKAPDDQLRLITNRLVDPVFELRPGRCDRGFALCFPTSLPT
jgi:hypothetical protein